MLFGFMLCGNAIILWHIYNVYEDAVSFGARIADLEVITLRMQLGELKDNQEEIEHLKKLGLVIE